MINEPPSVLAMIICPQYWSYFRYLKTYIFIASTTIFLCLTIISINILYTQVESYLRRLYINLSFSNDVIIKLIIENIITSFLQINDNINFNNIKRDTFSKHYKY